MSFFFQRLAWMIVSVFLVANLAIIDGWYFSAAPHRTAIDVGSYSRLHITTRSPQQQATGSYASTRQKPLRKTSYPRRSEVRPHPKRQTYNEGDVVTRENSYNERDIRDNIYKIFGKAENDRYNDVNKGKEEDPVIKPRSSTTNQKRRMGSASSGAFRVIMRKPAQASAASTTTTATTTTTNKHNVPLEKGYLSSPGQSQQDELKCVHFSSCSGCSMQSGFTSAPIMQRARKFFSAQGLAHELPIHIHYTNKQNNSRGDKSSSSTISGWRTHAKLAVQPMSKWGGVKIGLYRQGSHEVGETISSCQVQHHRINEAMEIFRRVAIDTDMPVFSPLTYSVGGGKKVKRQGSRLIADGPVRYVTMSVERSLPHRIALVIVLFAKDYKAIADLDRLSYFLKALKRQNTLASNSLRDTLSPLSPTPDSRSAKEDQSIWHSITLNFHPDPNSNTIYNFGHNGDSDRENSGTVDTSVWKHIWGLPYLKERIGNVTFFLRPQVFRQANLDGFESMILPMIDRYVPKGSTVAELYSGIGIIGLNLAYKANRVLCSDSNPYIDDLFDKSAQTLPEEDQQKVFFECLSADASIEEGQCDDASVLIADPPRKGLSNTVLDFLTNTLPTKPLPECLRRFIYVSCGYESLERDTRELISSGRWKLKTAEGFALFPGTDHIETVVVFDRVK